MPSVGWWTGLADGHLLAAGTLLHYSSFTCYLQAKLDRGIRGLMQFLQFIVEPKITSKVTIKKKINKSHLKELTRGSGEGVRVEFSQD